MQHSLHLYDPVILPRDYLTGEVVQLKDAPIDKNWKSRLRIMPTTCLLGYSSYSRPSSTILSLPRPPPAHLRRSLHPTLAGRSEREKENEERSSLPTTEIGGGDGDGSGGQQQQDQHQPSPSSSSIGCSLDNQMVSLASLTKASFPEPSPTTTHDSTRSSRSEMPISTLYLMDSKTVMDPFSASRYPTELFQEINHTGDLAYSHSLRSSLRFSLNPPSPSHLTANHTMYSGSTIARTSSYPHVRTLFSHQSDEWEMDETGWSVLEQLEEVLGMLARSEVVDDEMLMEVVSVSQEFQNVYAGKGR